MPSIENPILTIVLRLTNYLTPMTVEHQTDTDKLKVITKIEIDRSTEVDRVLCPHCLRTATNGIKCKGICVSDNDY